MPFAIELARVAKRLGRRDVVRDLSLQVPTGSVFAFLGNNGAGKSTTIRLLTGLLEADQGTVQVLGCPMGAARATVLRDVGCLVDAPALYPNLSALEFLDIGRRIKDLPRSESMRVLELIGLAASARERVAGFSLGMRQRLALAHALLGKPRLLILDEPGNGLDPQGMRDIRTLLASLPAEAGCTVFFSSHQLDEVEKFATHVAVLHGGRVLCQAPVPQLVASQAGSLALDVDDAGQAQAVLARLGCQVRILDTGRLDVLQVARQDGARLHAALVTHGVALYQSVYRTPTLEQWFLALTGHREDCDARDAVPA